MFWKGLILVYNKSSVERQYHYQKKLKATILGWRHRFNNRRWWPNIYNFINQISNLGLYPSYFCLAPQSWKDQFFWSKKLRKVLKRMENQFSDFEFLPLKILRIVWKKKFVPKYVRCSETDFALNIILFDTIFSSWDTVDFDLNIPSELETQIFLRTWFRNANQWYSITSWLGRFKPKASGTWGRSIRSGAILSMNREV